MVSCWQCTFIVINIDKAMKPKTMTFHLWKKNRDMPKNQIRTALHQASKNCGFENHYLVSCTDQNVALRACHDLLYLLQKAVRKPGKTKSAQSPTSQLHLFLVIWTNESTSSTQDGIWTTKSEVRLHFVVWLLTSVYTHGCMLVCNLYICMCVISAWAQQSFSIPATFCLWNWLTERP